MTHKLGNSTHCIDCRFYLEKGPDDHISRDGWCLDGLYIGNKKKADRATVNWNWGSGCDHWEDAETGMTHYEAMTRNVDPKRGPLERMIYEQILKGDKQ